MPHEPIDGELVYLVEMRSLSGHSGSPTFVSAFGPAEHRTAIDLLKNVDANEQPAGGVGPWLLGVDVGHVPIDVKMKVKRPSGGFTEETVTIENSGQAIVVPAQKVAELLNSQRFIALREAEANWMADAKKEPKVISDPMLDQVGPRPKAKRLKIAGKWEDAVGRALRKGKCSRGREAVMTVDDRLSLDLADIAGIVVIARAS